MGGLGSGVRRVLAVALALLAAVSLLTAAVSLAARRTLYEPSRAPDVAGRLLEEPAVRLAIAEKLTTRIKVLDPRLRETAVSDRLEELAELLTTTEPFQDVFTAAVVTLQRDLLDGGAPEVVLRLDGMLVALQDGMRRAGGELPIPDGPLSGVLVVERDQVETYRRVDDVTQQVGWSSLGVGLLAAAAAVAVSERRRGALLGLGATIAAAAALALGSLSLAKSAAAGQAGTAKGQEAVDAVWDVVARDIRAALAIVLIAGLVMVVAGLAVRPARNGHVAAA